MRVGRGVGAFFINAILIIFSFSCIFPLIWMFYSSLKEKRAFQLDIISLPAKPTFDNYVAVANDRDAHIWTALLSSFRTTVFAVLLIIVFGYVLGYLLGRLKFRGSKIFSLLLLLGLLIPIHSLLVPIYVVFNRLGIGDKWYTLIIPYVAFGLPIAVFLIHGYVLSVPKEFEEAAAIDGYGFVRTMFSILLPICMPILVTVAIIQTFACWNEFSFALVLINNINYKTVPLAMTQFTGQFNSNYPKMMAAMLLTMAPVVLFYFLFSKKIIEGMVAGAIKG
jgi:raffinose/stachyose/melibiose transport system permease protein